MNDYLKLLIENPSTGERLWFEHPFNINEIRKTLHINENSKYNVIDYDSSIPIKEYYNIRDASDEFETYLSLPEYIQKNIEAILDVVDSIYDVSDAIYYDKITLYSNCKNKYDFAIETLKERGDMPEDLRTHIDADKYLQDIIQDITTNSDIIETPDGIIEIKH